MLSLIAAILLCTSLMKKNRSSDFLCLLLKEKETEMAFAYQAWNLCYNTNDKN